MSHFYAQIDESARQTNATARGHKATNIGAVVASWEGGIRVRLWHDETTGQDRFEVGHEVWKDAGLNQIIAAGIVGKSGFIAFETGTIEPAESVYAMASEMRAVAMDMSRA